MGFKNPEQELEEFLAPKPVWAKKLFELSKLSEAEFAEMMAEDWADLHRKWLAQIAEYERLLRRIPSRWREYCKKHRKQALARVPFGSPGRPRKDSLAEEAKQLRAAGRTYPQIVTVLNQKHGQNITADAVRKLLSPRRPGPKPDKT